MYSSTVTVYCDKLNNRSVLWTLDQHCSFVTYSLADTYRRCESQFIRCLEVILGQLGNPLAPNNLIVQISTIALSSHHDYTENKQGQALQLFASTSGVLLQIPYHPIHFNTSLSLLVTISSLSFLRLARPPSQGSSPLRTIPASAL